jgi:phenylalanyl-tRNA synthetase beta subunit
VGYFSLNFEKLSTALYSIVQAEEVSSFQENNFDLNFVLDKTTPGKDIISAIKKTDLLIQKVELFDIYESEEKLA